MKSNKFSPILIFFKKITKGEKKYYWILGIAITTILIIWYSNYIILKELPFDERGTFGDMFGNINALFSGLALAGIIFTILLQRQELKLQRMELKETRKEFQIQNRTLKLQRFENTFFQMISIHHQIVNDIDIISQASKTKSGRDVFKIRYKAYLKPKLTNIKSLEQINKIYIQTFSNFRTDFGHYFRNLYRIIKHIEYQEFSTSDEEDHEIKYRYTSIVRAQLSDFELIWLFYNCLYYNNKNFKHFVEKYCLLNNIPDEELPDIKHKNFYEPEAFNIS